jgi:hypothetical protein
LLDKIKTAQFYYFVAEIFKLKIFYTQKATELIKNSFNCILELFKPAASKLCAYYSYLKSYEEALKVRE